jgi:hypothetical protein
MLESHPETLFPAPESMVMNELFPSWKMGANLDFDPFKLNRVKV